MVMEDRQMSKKTFQLHPFTSGALTGKISLSGSCARSPGTLVIDYRLQGALESIKRPVVSSLSHRCHDLWRHTCFELFFGIRGAPGYREVNVSPGGGWNVYHFTGYRTGMREDTSVAQPLCRVASGEDFLSLHCTIRINTIIADSSELEAGFSSVIETTEGVLSHWAIEHPASKPDFHDRRGFLIVLPGANGSFG